MYSDKIEYLKRAIKRAYKRYTGERTDETATIKDVADYFNITLDESRLEDYEITNIDLKGPSIEIRDNIENITYFSEYTSYSRLMDMRHSNGTYINSLTQGPDYEIERLFRLDEKTPVIEKLVFNDEEYILSFEREFPNTLGKIANDGVRFTIRLSQEVYTNGFKNEQPLLTKIYSKKLSGEVCELFEQQYTYSGYNLIRTNDNQDKYTYLVNNNVIYGIDNLDLKDERISINGICFENTNKNIDKYAPINLNINNFETLKDEETKSAMIFRGYNHKNRHLLEISKNSSNINIIYTVIDTDNKKGIVNRIINLQPLNAIYISSEEIQTIIDTLQKEFNDDEFIDLVSDELKTFANKIDIRNGVIKEENDLLNPKFISNCSLDDIAQIVSKNKFGFFENMFEQFEEATYISINKEKTQARVLNQNK